MNTRIERDSMGEMEVPGEALYGAQTARAVENFPISGQGLGRPLIRALGLIKLAAARVNQELGLLPAELGQAIEAAAREVADGALDSHFPVDIFQTGSGTSSNMNVNEVIANRAIQLLGGVVGSRHPVHPNDHVNRGQSSNDVFPSAIHLAALSLHSEQLIPALEKLHAALEGKAVQFDDIVKIGRTHLQDATPIRLGQEFSGYAAQVAQGLAHVKTTLEGLSELAIGGTAVGTGINTHPSFGRRMAETLSQLTGLALREAGNHFAAQASMDAAVRQSGALRALAVGLLKMANDIRLLGSGPRLGLGELLVPEVQPGSSIMPGKVNPVIAESLIMVCAQVIGDDTAVALGGLYGFFELNTMMPLIARNLLEQVQLLGAAVSVFSDRLVSGLRADHHRIEAMREQSLALATALAPVIGYDRAADIAKRSHLTGRTVRELAHEAHLLSDEDLDRVLDLRRQTEPG